MRTCLPLVLDKYGYYLCYLEGQIAVLPCSLSEFDGQYTAALHLCISTRNCRARSIRLVSVFPGRACLAKGCYHLAASPWKLRCLKQVCGTEICKVVGS
jgi:hypothetical protein